MSALFSAVLAKAAVFVVSFLLAATGISGDGTVKKCSVTHKPFSVSTAAQDTDKTDTTKTDSLKQAEKKKAEAEAREKEAQKARKAAKEKQKSVKISISDEGIKVGSKDGEEKVIMELDTEGLEIAIPDIEYDMDILENLPESVAVMLLEDDDHGYVKVRGRDIVRFGKDIHIGRRELVQGDVVCIAGDLTVEGKVRGNVVNVFGDTELYGTAIINGDVVTVMGELREYNNPHIRGETVNVAGGSPNIHLPFLSYSTGNLWGVITRIIKFVIFTLLLLMIIYFLPDRMKISSDHVFGNFFKSLGVGILVLLVGSIVVTILAVILSITIIGIPVALLLVLSYGALLLLGYFVSALALGRLLCQKFGPEGASPFLCGFMGLFLITLPGFIASMMWITPFLMPVQLLLKTIALFFSFLAVTLGSGALIISKVGALPLEQRPEVPEIPEETAKPAAPASYETPEDPQEPDVPEWPGPDEE
jgi:hypothetical protein